MASDHGIELNQLSPRHIPGNHPLASDLRSYASRRVVKDPRFSEFARLHHLNILRLEHDIGLWQVTYFPDSMDKDRKKVKKDQDRPEVRSEDMYELMTLLRDYTQAVRDFEYMRNLKDVGNRVAEEEMINREDEFDYLEKGGKSISTTYKTFAKRPTTPSDLLLNWVRTHLWRTLSWSGKERSSRMEAFSGGEDPDEFSVPTRLITSLAIATGCGAFLIAPIVIMTIPSTVSVAWSLTTMSLAILVFGACAALFLGPEPSTRDVVASTAAYAAVLVVFYGNIVNKLL